MQVEPFKYLGRCVTSDGRSTSDVKSRIAQARGALAKKRLFCLFWSPESVPGNQEEIYEEFHLERMHIWLRNLDSEENGEEPP